MKKAVKDNLQIVAAAVAGICAVAGILWGSYWIAKTASYSLYYEDMVKQTVSEMVDAKYLKTAN